MIIAVSKIDAILQAEDIEGLLNLGAPSDEYSHEAAVIKSALEAQGEDDATEDRVSALIENIWKHSFGPFSDDDIEKRSPAFRQVAQRILGNRS